jgi:hypothetical protein
LALLQQFAKIVVCDEVIDYSQVVATLDTFEITYYRYLFHLLQGSQSFIAADFYSNWAAHPWPRY